MKPFTAILASLFCFLTACQTPNPMSVEHVEIDLPLPEEGWEYSEKRVRGGVLQRQWGRDEQNNFTIQIHHHEPMSPILEHRDGMNEFARGKFKEFQSQHLLHDKVGGYERIIWETEILNSADEEVFTLYALIHGEDSTYLVWRQWKDEAEHEASRGAWYDYLLQNVRVVDPRRR